MLLPFFALRRKNPRHLCDAQDSVGVVFCIEPMNENVNIQRYYVKLTLNYEPRTFERLCKDYILTPVIYSDTLQAGEN